jgi:hypothetical protein
MILLSITVSAQDSYSDDELAEMEAQLERVFDFVGISEPVVQIEENRVIVDLDMPGTHTQEGTLAYIIINAAEIAPHTEEIVVRISSKNDGEVEASAETSDVLEYVDGKLTEEEFNDRIDIKNAGSTLTVIFAIVSLVIILIVLKKIYDYAKLHDDHRHIHKHHSVHDYMKKQKKGKKKKAVSKKRKKKR